MTVGTKILVAEDSEILQSLAKRAFEKEGYIVTQAFNGLDLMRELATSLPDIIVLDIALPDSDGRDLLAALKKDRRTAPVPVIVWSGRDTESDRRIVLELGAEDYVEKGPPSSRKWSACCGASTSDERGSARRRRHEDNGVLRCPTGALGSTNIAW